MPGHTDEKRTIMTVIGRPPVLRIGHQGVEIFLYRRVIELLKGLGIGKIRVHRIGHRGILMQDPEIELVRPPFAI